MHRAKTDCVHTRLPMKQGASLPDISILHSKSVLCKMDRMDGFGCRAVTSYKVTKNNVWFAGSAVLFQQQVAFLLVGLVVAYLADTAEALVKSIHAPNAPDRETVQ